MTESGDNYDRVKGYYRRMLRVSPTGPMYSNDPRNLLRAQGQSLCGPTDRCDRPGDSRRRFPGKSHQAHLNVMRKLSQGRLPGLYASTTIVCSQVAYENI